MGAKEAGSGGIGMTISNSVFFSLLAGALGYFVYDGLTGFFAMLGLYLIMSFFSLISIIPVIGLIIYIVGAVFFIVPYYLSFVGLEMSWLVYVIIGMNGLMGIVITAVVLWFIFSISR